MNKKYHLLTSLQSVKKKYREGENIIQHIRKMYSQGIQGNFLDAIAISYDLQSGSYIEFARKNKEHKQKQCQTLANVLGSLGPFRSLMEGGCGEGTTLFPVLKCLKNTPAHCFGFDISWSRVRYALSYGQRFHDSAASLFVGSLFHIPLTDNSIDVVFTCHAIEPNGGREKEILCELYRVARRYVVLLEPAFDFADRAGKERMKKHGYACGIYPAIKSLGYKVIEHRLFDVYSNVFNPTGLTIIEKKTKGKNGARAPLACPITRLPLQRFSDCYFSRESLLAYPIISGVPCLLPENAVVATHFEKFNRLQPW